MPRPFRTLDVFGTDPLTGNPLAVVADAEGLDTDTMQRIARWLNLSETTFLLPPTRPEADYRVRIFTLSHELPFAGHPTLGTCRAWLDAGGRPRHAGVVVQECGAGLVPVRIAADRLAFAAPPLLRSGPVAEDELARALAILRVPRAEVVEARWVDNGPGWMGILLDSAERVLAVEPERHLTARLDVGLVGPYPPGSPVAFELRALFHDGAGLLIEDPVTGSLNASVAQWLFDTGRAAGGYMARQGTRLGRDGRIEIARDPDGTVWVGGRAVVVVSGTLA